MAALRWVLNNRPNYCICISYCGFTLHTLIPERYVTPNRFKAPQLTISMIINYQPFNNIRDCYHFCKFRCLCTGFLSCSFKNNFKIFLLNALKKMTPQIITYKVKIYSFSFLKVLICRFALLIHPYTLSIILNMGY